MIFTILKGRIRSVSHALRGVREMLLLGANAKLQLAAAAIVLIAGVLLRFSSSEWMAVSLCIGLVLSAEAMNTALEELADEVSEERRERIRRAKDMAAGAVLIASATALIVATIIIGQRF
ncbi:diacylglycerol kinase family protein [Luteolibacter algae]|uniref:Diacylglycerol kinase family protein n=1 Tax=Luteolibacter algae TaxID=454151 RepID=A0ABW5D698_9BACT